MIDGQIDDENYIERDVCISNEKYWKFLNWFDGIKYLEELSKNDDINWSMPSYEDVEFIDDCKGLPMWHLGDDEYYKTKTLKRHKHWVVPVEVSICNDYDN